MVEKSETVPFFSMVLLAIAGVLVTLGSALLWAHTGSVTVDSHAQKAANYYIVGFYYIWLVALAIVWTRTFSRAVSGALYLLLGGLVFEGEQSIFALAPCLLK